MKERFKEWNPREETLERVEQCDAIIAEYAAQDLKLTLRQLYYQFVARGIIENTERSYKTLGSIVSNARLAGMLDWDAIEDRGRQPETPPEFDNLEQLVRAAANTYRLDRWAGQLQYVELWVEKAALAGVLQPLADEYHVTLMVNKGYSSQSAMYESAQRIAKASRDRVGAIFYLGDHDPSGQDMVRDITDRLNMFMHGQVAFEVITLALTTRQVEQYQPPPNPTKLSDSRATSYIRRHGRQCWEVDALDPATLQQLIRDALDHVIDKRLMDKVKQKEARDLKRLWRALAE